jgi:hypothetical protein
MANFWRRQQKPAVTSDPWHGAFVQVPNIGPRTRFAPTRSFEDRGGLAFSYTTASPFVNPIGAGIVPFDLGGDPFSCDSGAPGMLGPPPAQYVEGKLFYINGQGGPSIYSGDLASYGPLYDPATLAAILGQPSTAQVTYLPGGGSLQVPGKWSPS